jgi:hypothetical protein
VYVIRARKRSVEVWAVRWTGDAAGIDALRAWGARVEPSDAWGVDHTLRLWVEPEQSWVNCPMGHYIIKGVRGEFYPCAPEVFAETYDVLSVWRL